MKAAQLHRKAELARATARQTGVQRICAECGREYRATQEFAGYKRQYCSSRCSGEAARQRALSSYPPREEIVQLWCVEGMSDREVGARYGHSHQWSLNVRKAYGLGVEAKAKRQLTRQTTSHGYVRIGDEYENRLVAAQKAGRPLTPKESVHHIDSDRGNNDPENLVLYPSHSEHMYDERGRGAKRNKRLRAWADARGKVEVEAKCRVCARTNVRLEAAHIVARAMVAPGPGEHPDNIVPLCAERCHPAYDLRRLDLLPFLTLGEQAYAVLIHPQGLLGALRRVTGRRWTEEEAA